MAARAAVGRVAVGGRVAVWVGTRPGAGNRVYGVGVCGRVAGAALGLVWWSREARVYVAVWGLARRWGACG